MVLQCERVWSGKKILIAVDGYRILWHTLKILRKSQTYSQNFRESSHLSQTFSEIFKESHNTGFTDGLHFVDFN